jgi:lysine 2,3-aminomutase
MPQKARNSKAPVYVPTEVPLGDTEDEPPGQRPHYCSAPATFPFSRPEADGATIVPFPRFPAGSTSGRTRFRRKFFPGVSSKLWNDWHWQVSRRIRTAGQVQAMLRLSDEERLALEWTGAKLPLGITPYFMSLIAPNDPEQPLRRTVIPTLQEVIKGPGEADDPLGEESQSPVPGLVHRYPDRVLLLLSDFCSTYCRYCTRSRMVGRGGLHPSRSRLERSLEYIRATPSIRDVLLSGGDPLLLNDDRLAWILSQLRQIAHVEIVRIGTKVPAVLPQRITPQLVRMLRRYHPLWMSLHFTHPEECTAEAYRACAQLADGGIPLGSQTVLLKGINDDVETMTTLVHHLMKMRVRPYYLYQCDPITGSAHFRTPVEKGIEIIRGLRGFTSGYAVPTYVVDAPGGGGKIPLMPNYVVGQQKDALILRNYENGLYRYPNSLCSDSSL